MFNYLQKEMFTMCVYMMYLLIIIYSFYLLNVQFENRQK